MKLFDTHCHLDYLVENEPLTDILARAEAASVKRILTIATTLSKWSEVIGIARDAVSSPVPSGVEVRCSVGVHPHEAQKEGQGGVNPLREQVEAGGELVVAIGESGLDYHYNHSPPEAQRRAFLNHIHLAGESGLPLVVHSRAAEADTVAMLQEGRAEWGDKLQGVIHCFSEGRALMEGAIACGFHISLSGILTFKRANALRDLAREIPPERLLVETDAPYLAPEPKRGKRNEPAFVYHTLACLAAIRGEDPSATAETTWRNANALFTGFSNE